MIAKRILIVDDEENIGRSLRLILEREGYAVDVARSAEAFRARVGIRREDVYLLDVCLPDGSGIELLRWLRSEDDLAPIIMISGHGTIADAVEATRAGAFDFLEKPLARERVLLAVKNALGQAKLEQENAEFRAIVGDSTRMVGDSRAFRQAVDQAGRVARSDARVLLTGESGTGKELIAAHIHQESPLSGGPFVKVNCAAIPTELIESELFGHEKGAFTGATSRRRGKFERADGGTIFLDEVGDLHASSQAKLLRVLQEGEFERVGGERTVRTSVRVIAATNRNLEQLIARDEFREDLYYRLSVVPIRVPPLRERREDIGPLSEYFLADFCSRNNFHTRTLEEDTLNALEGYRWPGNVRELRNTVERMAILAPGDRITVDSIPVEIRQANSVDDRSGLKETRESAERLRIMEALEASNWSVAGAARSLGIGRTNLHKRMKALGVERRSR